MPKDYSDAVYARISELKSAEYLRRGGGIIPTGAPPEWNIPARSSDESAATAKLSALKSAEYLKRGGGIVPGA